MAVNNSRAPYPIFSLPFAPSLILLGWAALYTQQGKLPQTARLMGAVDKIYKRTKMCLSPHERDENAEALAAARLALGEQAFAAAWQVSKAMTFEQAVALALEEHE